MNQNFKKEKKEEMCGFACARVSSFVQVTLYAHVCGGQKSCQSIFLS